MLTKQEKQEMIKEHYELPAKIAYSLRFYGIDKEDLIQEGYVGLLMAADRYDQEKVNNEDKVRAFGVYAYSWVKMHMYEFIVKNVRISKIVTTKNQRKMFFNLKKEKDDHNTTFTDSDIKRIAEKYNVRECDVREMESRLTYNNNDVYYMGNKVVNDNEFSDFDYNEFLSTDVDPYTEYYNNELEQNTKLAIEESLNTLPERSRDIIEKRILSDDKTTLEDLGKQYDVSLEWIRQIEKNALNKMKTHINNSNLL